MSALLLIRHGLCDTVGRVLAGRSPGIHLNPAGKIQVRQLARELARLPISAVYSSPLERARETAAALAEQKGLPVTISPGLEELDYGTWTGRSLESLTGDPLWREFNTRRGATRIPDGETMDEVVARASRALEAMVNARPKALVAAVTHGDVIRALLAHWAGMSLDHMLRLEIAPASVTAVRLGPEARVLVVNWLPDLGPAL